MRERDSLRSIARRQVILQDELTRLYEEQAAHAQQLEELDILKRRAVEEAREEGRREGRAALLGLITRCHAMLKTMRSTGVDDAGRLRDDLGAELEQT
jgi:hypothetical protein